MLKQKQATPAPEVRPRRVARVTFNLPTTFGGEGTDATDTDGTSRPENRNSEAGVTAITSKNSNKNKSKNKRKVLRKKKNSRGPSTAGEAYQTGQSSDNESATSGSSSRTENYKIETSKAI